MESLEKQLTPLMKQYFEIKKEFQDSILLFQVGDFYELFFDDAKKAAVCLNITLTKRGNVNGEPIPLCGVPVHSIEHYLGKLIKNGFKVVICDQLELAQPGKVVRRGVTKVLTPGTLTDSKLLNEKSSSYLFSFFPMKNNWGLLFGEILTAQLFATSIPANAYKSLETELTRFFPDEILIPFGQEAKQLEAYFKQLGYFATIQQDEDFDAQSNFKNWLNSQFNVEALKTISENEVLKLAVYNFFIYLKKNQESCLTQFKNFNFYNPDDFLILDSATQRNLEIVKNINDNSTKNTLFELLDRATTSMGSRMIKKWMVRPLLKYEAIIARQNAVGYLVGDVIKKEKLIETLNEISDLERVVGRIALRRANLNDYLALCKALTIVPQLKKILYSIEGIDIFNKINADLIDCSSLKTLLLTSLNDDQSKNWIIKNNYDASLDNLRELAENSNNKIFALEQQEQKATGITSLKIRYNQVHGYYIEITKANINLVPQHYIRHQTLAGKERYLTPQLQLLESEIENARNEIVTLENEIFEQIKKEVEKNVTVLRRNANVLANLDALIGFANVAYENNYIKPTFNENQEIIIEEGKHPIVQKIVGNNFIANSTYLTEKEQLWIITGPNMGGKSTYLRQVALICIMAQCGSFVPAKSASLPILDRIFTRIGAGDNLAEGKSTFLVEMEETATICSQATNKSLVILDEVGRGTSTFDGLAIAQAVIEYIYSEVKAKCLFATHYHELTELKNKFPALAVYHAASKKTDSGILLLHKIIKGTANGSFGIEVAKLANLPKDLVLRAAEILEQLNQTKYSKCDSQCERNILTEKIKFLEKQLDENQKFMGAFSNLNFDELSPKKAFDILWNIKQNL